MYPVTHEDKLQALVDIGLEEIMFDNDILEDYVIDLLIRRGLVDMELYFPEEDDELEEED